MKIPEKYRDIYSQAKQKDSKLEKGKNILSPRNLVVRHVQQMIRLENDIEAAKQQLKEYGIDTNTIM